jgi:hypothetical protein
MRIQDLLRRCQRDSLYGLSFSELTLQESVWVATPQLLMKQSIVKSIDKLPR